MDARFQIGAQNTELANFNGACHLEVYDVKDR
jgi:hypothetical protein